MRQYPSGQGFYIPTMDQLALTFANQAAIALENARLFQQVTKAADKAIDTADQMV